MPSTYAHYRFGQDVLKKLPENERDLISCNKQLYMIGLHGPDILFYYKALSSNPINKRGSQLHKKSGRYFFENAERVISKQNYAETYFSYAYGVLCHFALDVSCHAYIDEKIAESGISHTEIESEFDRILMLADGINPVTHAQTSHIIPSDANAEIIADFYAPIKKEEIKKSLQSMILQSKMLIAKTDFKRNLIYNVLRMTGNYDELHGMIINPKGNPECKDSNKKLLSLYKTAELRAVDLIKAFEDNVKGKTELDSIFDYSFGGVPVKK